MERRKVEREKWGEKSGAMKMGREKWGEESGVEKSGAEKSGTRKKRAWKVWR